MKYVYGPVHSRRLGNSLGITTVPPKICSFNCVFCEVGRTTKLTSKRHEYIKADLILNNVREFLEDYHGKLDHITFSGFGEPTLNSKLGYIIKEIKKTTDIPVVVLTNSSLISRKDVRGDLLNADIVKFSLSAATQEYYNRINQNTLSIRVEDVIKGIQEFRTHFKGDLWIEIMLVKDINDVIENYIALKEAIKMISPDKVHINTIVRSPAFSFARPLTMKELLYAKDIIGHNAEVIPLKYDMSYAQRIFAQISHGNFMRSFF